MTVIRNDAVPNQQRQPQPQQPYDYDNEAEASGDDAPALSLVAAAAADEAPQRRRRTPRHKTATAAAAASANYATQMALVLTTITLVLLGLLSVAFSGGDFLSSSSSFGDSSSNSVGDSNRKRWLAQDDSNDDDNNNNNNENDYSSYSCSYLYEHTPYPGERQCAFAQQCNGGDGIWASFVFCSTRFSTATLVSILSPAVLLWLVLLFRMLSSTAEDFFSPSLEMFSVKLGLPPRFAGVSLLALGNGAADVSATVSAISADPAHGYQLSLGALTGAAMFISSVVSAVVVLAADDHNNIGGSGGSGVPCRGALVRDVAMLAVTVGVVWQQLSSGHIGPDTMTLFLSLYLIFVVLVLVADIYHRAIVVPRMTAAADQAERHRQLESQRLQEAAIGMDQQQQQQQLQQVNSQESSSTHGSAGGGAPRTRPSRLARVITALSNYDNQDVPPGGWGVESDDLAQDRPIVLHGTHGILHGDGHIQQSASSGGDAAAAAVGQDPQQQLLEMSLSSPDQESAGAYRILDDAVDRVCVEPGSLGYSASNWAGAWKDAQQELLQHAATVWDGIVWNPEVHLITKVLLLLELPFTTLRKITVPIPCEGYYCRALIAGSLALSPAWLAYYLWHGHEYAVWSGSGWIYFGSFWLVMIVAALLLLRWAPGGCEGSLALQFSTPIALYGFGVAATWIDSIADALVSVLNFIGIILRIPAPVIGLTILAWGNSMADLSANATMARKGLGNMAMTACFAGPVFNILVGLGLGFGSLAARYGQVETAVTLSSSVVTGFVFLLLNAAAILLTGLVVGKGRINKIYGYVALVLYGIYVILSIVLQYSSSNIKNDNNNE